MLKCSTSLWFADLAAKMKRVEPYTERFHLDVADGRYLPTLLFFPDLVKALQPHTRLPFAVHLMTADSAAMSASFDILGLSYVRVDDLLGVSAAPPLPTKSVPSAETPIALR